ncbi:hypothetical protein [Vibrio diazotrophicus]|uniref:hypothetical protein n=1 Tax=Vibrio diazotrophicus TaxID=685 RepID=UPI000C9DF9FD|nr:hypothetical protein [Vibrio diazotrophicus]PNH91812.1 hypothetical protein C1M59_12125 [Vibrio diazotrophicus]
MRKKILAVVICGLAFGTNAANFDDLRISGFGSVGFGQADNDVGYAGYEDQVGFKYDTLLGLQFDFQVNDRASVTTQIVANGRYNFEPAIEVAYLSYDIDFATIRGGKIRTPFFIYSDYLDVGYAYPMLRPSQEIYEHLIISSFTGVDLLLPIDIGDSTLQLQPYLGVSQLEDRDIGFDETVDLNEVLGLAGNWFIGDWTLHASYVQAELEPMNADPKNPYDLVRLLQLDKQQAAIFHSLGIQYNDGDWLLNVEAMTMELEGAFYDVEAASALVGYQFGQVTPYLASAFVETTDDENRLHLPPSKQRFERTSYSLGLRWDFASNIAMKLDTTYADFGDTNGNFSGTTYHDTFVYSASVDFVF